MDPTDSVNSLTKTDLVITCYSDKQTQYPNISVRQ